MGRAVTAAELILTEDNSQAELLAHELCELNRQRQAVELEIFNQCLALLAGRKQYDCLVLADKAWHQGVVGIVASRLAEQYACPVFMICLQDDGKGKGSCRSYGGFNLFCALERCADLLEGYGGHALAAGFTIQEENIPAFRARMEEIVRQDTGGEEMVSTLQIDGEIENTALLTVEEVEALSMLEPYGAGNPKPVFSCRGLPSPACPTWGRTPPENAGQPGRADGGHDLSPSPGPSRGSPWGTGPTWLSTPRSTSTGACPCSSTWWTCARLTRPSSSMSRPCTGSTAGESLSPLRGPDDDSPAGGVCRRVALFGQPGRGGGGGARQPGPEGGPGGGPVGVHPAHHDLPGGPGEL
ncbi:MAG: DHHA1 domain-containing protein [Evtepia gabavorous]